jgi:hypothetical protein
MRASRLVSILLLLQNRERMTAQERWTVRITRPTPACRRETQQLLGSAEETNDA